jgi:hypothetical protein
MALDRQAQRRRTSDNRDTEQLPLLLRRVVVYDRYRHPARVRVVLHLSDGIFTASTTANDDRS